MVTNKTKLLQLTKEKDCKSIKLILESLDYQIKGSVLEWYLAELYRGISTAHPDFTPKQVFNHWDSGKWDMEQSTST